MKRKLLAIATALVMAVTGMTGWVACNTGYVSADAEELYEIETLEGAVDTEKNNYMTDSQYKKLFGVDLDSKNIEAFDPDNTDNPLEGYEPAVLSELFLGYMNRTNNYDGQFAVMENASNDSGFNLDTMWNTNYGGVTTYYGEDQNEDMYTHAISTIAVTPGDLTEEGASTRQQILVENRIYLDEEGVFYEDDTYQMLNTYTMVDGSWTRTQCKNKYLSDAHWAWYIDVPEQQAYTAMAVGDYDGDNHNEVAVYVPANSHDDEWAQIEIYQPVESGNTYTLNLERTVSLKDIGPRFGIEYDKYFPYVHLNTTKIAGRDDLVVAGTLPYHERDAFNDNGALAVISFQNGNTNIEFNTDLKYDDNAYRFKMQATVNADLDGNGTDELVVGGFKNTGYSTRGDDRGEISDSEYLVNVLLYENGAYKLAWSKPQVTVGIDLNHSRAMDAPVAMAAGKYRTMAVADTVFLEGTYLDFFVGGGDTANERIKNGTFKQDISENMSGLSNATINIGASGTFVSDKPGNEEVIFYTTHGSGDVDVDIRWGHPAAGGKIATTIVKDNYIDDTEEDDGTIVNMCPVNVDQDSSMIKYKGKTVGWSNPIVYGILMSMPYWQELDYGDVWNDRGETDFGITKSKEDGTSVTAGVDVGATVNISGEVTVFGNGVGAGVDIGAVGSYAYENSKSKELSKGITWSVGGGQDSAALMVMPIVTYEYEVIVPEHEATKEEQAAGKSGTIAELVAPVACTSTFEPVITDIPIGTYNDVIEEFNIMAEAAGNSQDKLPLIDLDEIYSGAKTGDPSSYVSDPKNISSLTGEEGKDYYYVGEVHAQTGKDKSVETLNIETVSSQSESNGFTAGLKGSVMGKVIGGLDFMSIVSATGSVGITLDAQAVSGKTWVSTESTGITYSGSFANIPSEAEGYGYEYSAGLVKWNAALEGFDQELTIDGTDEMLPDKTIVIGPTVTMLDASAPPAVPVDLHVLGVTEDTAVLEWTNPEGKRAADYYKVYYSKDGSSYHPLTDTVSGDKSRYVVTGLSAYTEYYFKLEGYDSETSMRSVKSAPVNTVTKAGGEPVVTMHPVDCYAKVGEKALFNIAAEPYTAGNSITYQWQQLAVEDYGISWNDINVASDNTIGRTGEFNAAYASPEGLIRTQDVDNLNGNVYRCIVAEHQAGKLDYNETASNSATLHIGSGVMSAERSLKIEAGDGTQKSDSELLAAAGDDITVTALLTDKANSPLAGTDVYFSLTDKAQDGKCIAYLSGKTAADGKASVTFEDITAGEYEALAVVKGEGDDYKPVVSNSIQITANESYSIVYELNGGTNHNLNPVRYALGTKIIILRDASREGYEFTGWYFDKELQHRIENKWLDVSEMTGMLTLYAGWIPIEEEQPATPDDPQTPEDDQDKPVTPPDDPQRPDGPSDGNDNRPANPDSDKPADESDPEQNNENDQKTPARTQTGDDTNMTATVLVMIAALISCLTALLARRRKS